jgi:hypothetical protein
LEESETWDKITPILGVAYKNLGIAVRTNYTNGVVLNMLDALSDLDITGFELVWGLEAFFRSNQYLELDKPEFALSYFAKGMLEWVAKGEPAPGGAPRRDVIYWHKDGGSIVTRYLSEDNKPTTEKFTEEDFIEFRTKISSGRLTWQEDKDGSPINPKFIEEKNNDTLSVTE